MPTIYPNLSTGAARRLQMFRAEALKPGWVRPMTWRDVRFANLTSESGLCAGFNGATPIWYGFDVDGYFRRIRPAHGIVNLRHTGWYTDADATETAWGIVASLPHGRFLAGYYWASNGEYVFYPEVFEDETDAARTADGHAEAFADSAREDSERFNAMADAETALQDALDALQDARALRRAGRRGTDEVREVIETLREARETLAECTAAYERG